MWVKPAAGLVVRDPRTKTLVPSDGLEVPDTDLDFARLVRDGDLIVSATAPSAPPALADAKGGEA